MTFYLGQDPNQPFVSFDSNVKANSTVYSDRLFQWDPKKHDELCRKYWDNTGQYWGGRSPESIEAFLREYEDDNTLVLCRIEEHKNQSSGYPLWRLDYFSTKLNKV